jgi:sporulation protein YlmC with PRC-barrel domain
MRETTDAGRTLLVEDLMGKEVQTAEGRALGRVFELRLSSGPDFGVEALLLGRAGLAYRFDLARAVFVRLGLGKARSQDIPWSAVASFDGEALILREGWSPGHGDASTPGDSALKGR